MSQIVKNPNRDRPRPVEIRKPEYERLGVNPIAVDLNKYARTENLPIAKKPGGPISAVDGELFDQYGDKVQRPSEDGNFGHIIDNNEFINFGFSSEQKMSAAIENGDFIDLDSEIKDKSQSIDPPAVGDYILMIAGDIIMSGKLKIIEDKVKNILYGEDIDFEPSKVSQEDIVVLKRVDLQIGVFIKD